MISAQIRVMMVQKSILRQIEMQYGSIPILMTTILENTSLEVICVYLCY